MVPVACFSPPALRPRGPRLGRGRAALWRALERNWGIGDFTDLATLIGLWAEKGADVFGVNPLARPFSARPGVCQSLQSLEPAVPQYSLSRRGGDRRLCRVRERANARGLGRVSGRPRAVAQKRARRLHRLSPESSCRCWSCSTSIFAPSISSPAASVPTHSAAFVREAA